MLIVNVNLDALKICNICIEFEEQIEDFRNTLKIL